MCGNVGVFGKNLTFKHREYFVDALYADALRGKHGTGIFSISNSGNVDIFKKAMSSSDLIDTKRFEKFMINAVGSTKAYIGHNRHATRGGISDKTTHPFQHGDITMVHNGSLISTYQLPDNKDFTVDSDNIAHSLNVAGVDETIKKLNGSFSLVWHNAVDDTLNFIRNSERPMYIGKVKDADIWMYASEGEMLAWIANRRQIDIESIFLTDVMKLYSFNMKDGSFELTTREVEEYKPTFPSRYIDNFPAKAHSTTNDTLKSLGVKMGETVMFSMCEFEAYNPGGTKGILTGYMDTVPYEAVMIFNVTMPKNIKATFTANVCGYRETPPTSTKESAIVLAPSSLKEMMVYEGEQSNGNRASYYEHKEFVGPNGIILSGHQWDELTRDGCSNCTGNLFTEHHKEIVWKDSQTPICPECISRDPKLAVH